MLILAVNALPVNGWAVNDLAVTGALPLYVVSNLKKCIIDSLSVLFQVPSVPGPEIEKGLRTNSSRSQRHFEIFEGGRNSVSGGQTTELQHPTIV